MKFLYIYGAIYEGEIDLKYVQSVVDSLEKDEELTVYINSPGGSVFEGLAIFNVLAPLKPTVKVIGLAASMASVIACAGRVLIADSAFMMIHNPWTVSIGDAEYHKKVTNELQKIQSQIKKIYITKTGKSEEEITAIMEQDTYLNAQECLDLKLADEIYKPNDKEIKQMAINQFVAFNKIINYKLGGNMPNNTNILQGDDNNLQAKLLQLQSDFSAKLKEIETLTAANQRLTEESIQLKSQLDSMTAKSSQLQTDLDNANSLIKSQEHQVAVIEILSLLKELHAAAKINSDDIKPNESDPDKLSILGRKLITLKESGLKFNDSKTLYQLEVEELQARKPMVTAGRDLFRFGNVNREPLDRNEEINQIFKEIEGAN